MRLLNQPIILPELDKMAKSRFGNLVKAVVDLEKKLMVVDAEMHADEEQLLLQQGSSQSSLWGINLYPDKFGTADFVEFDSYDMTKLEEKIAEKTKTEKKKPEKLKRGFLWW